MKIKTLVAPHRRHAAPLGLMTLGAFALSPPTHAQGYTTHEGRVGLVAEADIEYGLGDYIHSFYSDGTPTSISAGQGVTLSLGAHYKPVQMPIDFAATLGYKFNGIDDRDSDLGLYRWVLKLTGTYELPQRFYVDAGPVLHLGTKLRGDGLVPDIPFDDAVGVTFGGGWRFIGVSYTYIRYTSSRPALDLDGSNIGINLTFKF